MQTLEDVLSGPETGVMEAIQVCIGRGMMQGQEKGMGQEKEKGKNSFLCRLE